MKRIKFYLSNGETMLQIKGNRTNHFVHAGKHIVTQDESGNYYIDGEVAYLKMTFGKHKTLSDYDCMIKNYIHSWFGSKE